MEKKKLSEKFFIHFIILQQGTVAHCLKSAQIDQEAIWRQLTAKLLALAVADNCLLIDGHQVKVSLIFWVECLILMPCLIILLIGSVCISSLPQ